MVVICCASIRLDPDQRREYPVLPQEAEKAEEKESYVLQSISITADLCELVIGSSDQSLLIINQTLLVAPVETVHCFPSIT